jgi:Ca2+-transporting ATPase
MHQPFETPADIPPQLRLELDVSALPNDLPFSSVGHQIQILHQSAPGRLRLKVSGLYRSDKTKSRLERQISGLRSVESVTANPLTGNVLIHFDVSQARLDELLSALVSATHAVVIDAPVAATARTEPGTPWLQRLGKMLQGLKPVQGLPHLSMPDFRSTPESTAIVQSQPAEAWHVMDPKTALALLHSSKDGLDNLVVRERLKLYGHNVLGEARGRSPLAIFAGQFISIPVAMLGASAAISIATGGLIDAAVIGGVVVINAIIGYVTESSAERTINALGTLTPTSALVIRDGREQEVAVADLVIGDLLVLTPGSYIPADARLLSSNRLTIDESALTGESLPVGKHANRQCDAETPLGERVNMVHMGTVVTGGSGLALVTATGLATEIGQIQALVGEVAPPETPMQRQLDQMGVQLAALSGAICFGVFAVGVLRGYGWMQMMGSCISLAVAAVPEGLPAVATTTLSIGIKQMQKRHVLIRQLSAVESLGSVEVLCLDKTGTLTLNRMKVVSLHTVRQSWEVSASQPVIPLEGQECVAVQRLLEVVILCSEVKGDLSPGGHIGNLEGSPTECALVEAGLGAGLDGQELRDRLPLVKMEHRAENRAYMLSVHQSGEGFFVAVKGSPSEVLALCGEAIVDGQTKALTAQSRRRILLQNEAMASNALRVLGVAYCEVGKTADDYTGKLIWLGVIGMEDSMRPGMAELMGRFHDAGIQTVMITGDQSATAYSVGKRLALNNDRPLEIVDSVSLDRLEPEILSSIVKDTTVFARVSPAHKLKIVQAFQRNGRVVAMTGDGINDGPALKASDVGVAMGKQGTDVARAVADVVLQDDNLHTMIAAVEQGRAIYANIRKSLRFLLSTNLSEIQVMLVTTALGMGEALNPMQLLWINLLTDIFPALALALEPPEQDVLKQKPRDPSEPIIRRQDFMKLLKESSVISAGCLAVYLASMRTGGLGARASTNAFMTLTTSQLLHSLACRSEETTVLDASRDKNPYLAAALAGSLGLQVLAVFVPQLRQILRLSPLALADITMIVAGAGIPFVINEGTKHLRLSSANQDSIP